MSKILKKCYQIVAVTLLLSYAIRIAGAVPSTQPGNACCDWTYDQNAANTINQDQGPDNPNSGDGTYYDCKIKTNKTNDSAGNLRTCELAIAIDFEAKNPNGESRGPIDPVVAVRSWKKDWSPGTTTNTFSIAFQSNCSGAAHAWTATDWTSTSSAIEEGNASVSWNLPATAPQLWQTASMKQAENDPAQNPQASGINFATTVNSGLPVPTVTWNVTMNIKSQTPNTQRDVWGKENSTAVHMTNATTSARTDTEIFATANLYANCEMHFANANPHAGWCYATSHATVDVTGFTLTCAK